MHGQLLLALGVLQEGFFLLDGLLLPGLEDLGALHHFGGFMADIAAVPCPTADFARLDPVRPIGRAAAGRPQAADFRL